MSEQKRPIGRPAKPKAARGPNGGARAGAGRPTGATKPDTLTQRINIRLTESEQSKAAASGLTQREIFLIGLNSI
jgi:hypothetical protein